MPDNKPKFDPNKGFSVIENNKAEKPKFNPNEDYNSVDVKKKVETTDGGLKPTAEKPLLEKPKTSLEALQSGLQKSQASRSTISPTITAPLQATPEQVKPSTKQLGKSDSEVLKGFDVKSELPQNQTTEPISPVDLSFQTEKVKPIEIAGIKGGTKQNIEKNQKYYETINTQKQLKNQGFNVDVTGIEDDKTKLALNLSRDKTKNDIKESFGEADFYKSVDNLLTKDKSFYNEEKLVPYLQNKFGKEGFEFSESGIGDEVTVSYKPDGQTETRNISVYISEEGLSTLKDFMKQTRLNQAEKGLVSSGKGILPSNYNELPPEERQKYDEQYQNKMVELMASNPYKYGKTLINEDYFTNIVNDRTLDLKVSAKNYNDSSDQIEQLKQDYNSNPTEEKLAIVNKAILDHNKMAKDILERKKQLEDIQSNYKKATGFYLAQKEDKGNFLGMVTGSFAKGFTSLEKQIVSGVMDELPYVLGTDSVIDPVTKSKLDYLGYTDDEMKDYASKEIKRQFLPKLEAGVQDFITGESTTKEYGQSEKRNEFEKVVNFLTESLGAAASGGGNPALQKTAFFAMSKNAIDDEMRGTDFDGLSENEKLLVSVPYALTIGALENLGFNVSTKIGSNTLLNKFTKSVLAKTFSSLPKNASVELIEETINKNVAASLTETGLKIVGGALVEGATEGVQKIDEIAIKNIANAVTEKEYFKNLPDLTTTEGVKETLSQALQDAKYGFYGGLILSGGSTALESVSNKFDEKRNNDEFSIFVQNMIDDKLFNISLNEIDRELELGNIDEETANSQKQALEQARTTINSIPDNLSVTDKRRSFDLINEKSIIEKEIEGKDKSLVVKQTERINQINEKLKAIGSGEKVVEEQAPTETKPTEEKEVDVTDTNVGEIAKPTIETVEGEKPSYTDTEGRFYSEKEVVEMPQEKLSQMKLQNPSEQVLNRVEEVFPTQQEIVKEETAPIKEQEVISAKPTDKQATEATKEETDVNKVEKINYRVDDVNADNYGDVVFNNPNYIVRGGAGNKATEGYYSWDRNEAKQYADGDENNLFEGELKPDSKILELETNEPENYQENADAISEFEKITGMTYDSESFSNITKKEIKLLRQAGYDAVRGATIDGLATVVVNKDSITPLNQQPTPSVEQIDTQEKSVEKTAENVQIEEKTLAETKFKKVADNIRKLKTSPAPKLINPDTGEEIEITKMGLDWNDLVESIALAVEKTGDVVGSVQEYLGKQEWYAKLSDAGKKSFEKQIIDNLPQEEVKAEEVPTEKKPKVEKQVPPSEPKQKKEKTEEGTKENISRQSERAIEMQDNQSEMIKKVEKLSSYKQQDQDEFYDNVSDLIDSMGERASVQYVSNPSNEVSQDIKQAVLTIASARQGTKANNKIEKAIESNNEALLNEGTFELEEAMLWNLEASQYATKAGQIIAFKNKVYKENPAFFSLSKKKEFDNSFGASKKEKEQIKDFQSDLQQGVEDIVNDVTTNEEIEKLKAQVEELKKRLSENKSEKESKAKSKERKIKDIQSKRKSLFDELRKESKGGQVSVSLGFLNSKQIELIGKIVGTYIEEGVVRTDKIVNDIYNNLKDSVGGLRKDHIRSIARENPEFEGLLKKETEKQENELSAKFLRDTVNDHLLGRKVGYRSLAQSIAQKSGLPIEEIQDLADLLEEKIRLRVEELILKEHSKFIDRVNNAKPKFAELKRKELSGNITEEESKQIKKMREDSKNRQESSQIMKAIMMGGLSSSVGFRKAFEKRFGFREIDETVSKQIDAIAHEMFTIQNEVEKEVVYGEGNKQILNSLRRQRLIYLQNRLNSLLETQKPITLNSILRGINSMNYIGMLSGPTTYARSALGGYISGALGAGAYVTRKLIGGFITPSNYKYLLKSFGEMIKSIPSAYYRAIQTRKTGIDLFGNDGLVGEISGDKKSKLEQALWSDVKESFKNKDLKVPIKIIGQIVKNIQALGSLDAFMNTLSGNFVGTMEALQAGERKNIADKEFESVALEEWNELKENITKFVESKFPNLSDDQKTDKITEIIKKELGITGSRLKAKKVFITNRSQELKENMLEKYFRIGVSLAKDASMMNKSDGVAGLLTEKYQKFINIKDTDNAIVSLLKTIPNFIFKFPRITGNVITKSFNNIPLIGIANAGIGIGRNVETGELELGKWNQRYLSNPDLFKQRAMLNLMTTATLLIVWIMMYEDNDDEGLKLKEDRLLDLRGFGGDFQKMGRKYEDYQNLSVSFTRDEKGNFTNYIRLELFPELATIGATLGYFSDILKGDVELASDDVQKTRLKEFKEKGITPMNVINAFAQNTKIFTESSFSSFGKIRKDYQIAEKETGNSWGATGNVLLNILIDNIKPIAEPRAIESAIKLVQSLSGENEKELKGWKKFAKNLYGLDGFVGDEKTDVFGNPYPKTNDYTDFIKRQFGAGENRSDKLKEVDLLYKFEQGANISKRNFTEMKTTSRTGFTLSGESDFGPYTLKYISNDDKLAIEAQDIQEKYFRKLVLENYSSLNTLETKEELEEELKALQEESTQYAKEEIVSKYEGTKKITEITD